MFPNDEPRSGDYIPGGGQSHNPYSSWQTRVRYVGLPTAFRALGFGTMLAIAISYHHNESIGWAIVHGILSWFFVIYAALFY